MPSFVLPKQVMKITDDMTQDTSHPKTRRFGCTVAVLVVSVFMFLTISRVLYFLIVAFTDFDFHRDKMCLRHNLSI